MRKVEIDHFIHYRQPRNLHLDDDGNIFYILRSVSAEEDQYVDSLLRSSVRGDQIIHSESEVLKDHTFLHWLNRNEMILKDENGNHFVFNPKTGAFHGLFTVKSVDIQKIIRLERNQYLILGRETAVTDKKYLIADEYPFLFNGAGNCNRVRSSLYLCEEGQFRKLTSEQMDVGGLDAFEGEYAVFYGCEYKDVRQTTGAVFKLDLKTLSITEIETPEKYVYTSVSVIDRERVLLIRNDRSRYGEYQDEYLDEYNLKTGKTRRLNGDSLYHLYDDVNTDVSPGIPFAVDFTVIGDEIYFTATVGSSCHLFIGNFDTGEVKPATHAPGKVMEFAVGNDKVHMIAMRDYGGAELYELDLETLTEKKRSNLNSFSNEYNFFNPEQFAFRNRDGMELDGWIMKPQGLEEDERVPSILYIHGGPNTAYGVGYIHEMQYFCELGYGIIYCNPRGSIGKGADFADLRGKYGTIDYQDLLDFVDTAAREHPWIDKDRLGVTGGSYGGYMTNWMIGHTDLFRAAVSSRSTANILSDFFLSEIGFSFTKDTYQSTPWDKPEVLWNGSPIKYAPNIKTPTLFIQGGDDFICSKDQAVQMFAALKFFGIPARLVIMEGEDHCFTVEGTPSVRMKRLDEMRKWFDHYLRQ